MIYTLTLNPSVDYVIETDSFQLGQLNRLTKEEKFPGGKGINITRVLKRMDVESIALGFIGGLTGKYIHNYLETEQIHSDFIVIKEDTRINVKLKTDIETELNANGPKIESDDWHTLLSKVQQLTQEDVLILSGSVPPSLPENTYEKLAEICSKQKIPFIVDAEKNLLASVLPYHPFLIKPNHHELGDIFQTTIVTTEEAIRYSLELVKRGAQNVIVSMADKGAILVNKRNTYIASVPQGKVISSVGAGDSLVAGFIGTYRNDENMKEAFRFGVASGSATAFSVGLCTMEKVESLLTDVKIEEKE